MKKFYLIFHLIFGIISQTPAFAQKIQSIVYEGWNGSGWQYSSKADYSYDSNFYLISILNHSWNGSAWQNSSQIIYTNDINGNALQYLSQSWNSSANTFSNSLRMTSTYTANKALTGLYESWNGSGWQNSSKMDYNYDANIYLISYQSHSWNGSAWQNSGQITYTNDGSGNPLQYISQSWNSTANTYSNSLRLTSTFTVNKPLTGLYEGWNGSGWQNSTKYNYTYDANLNIVSQMNFGWNGSAWQNGSQTNFTNATYGPLQYISQSWNSTANTYSNSLRVTWTYINEPPSVTTASASGITNNSANCGGNTTSDGGASITTKGVCWSISPGPTTANQTVSAGSGTGSYTVNLTGLMNATTYYARAFATNSVGTSYGNEVSFATLTSTDTATGIREFTNEKITSVYPVPATDVIYLNPNNTYTGRYMIYTITGECVLTVNFNENDKSINISSLAKGIYFLKSENGQRLKFIKE